MATKKWFVNVGEEEMGPLGPNGLRRLVRSGKVQPGTMVRREDHELAVRADHLRGLFSADDGGTVGARERRPAGAGIHGPFTSMRILGWSNAAVLGLWVLVGAFGIITALAQRGTALAIAGGDGRPLTAAGAPFFGIGGIPAVVLFFATGVLFVYWLWCARVNLPHLLHARIRYSPAWTIVGWLVPIVNLLRPYEVVEEIDRLSAEAKADGDASVRADRRLIVPWWICTLALLAATVFYVLMPTATANEIATAAVLHAVAGAAAMLAAAFGVAVVLHISLAQELAHDRHPDPVQLHHEFHGRHSDAVGV